MCPKAAHGPGEATHGTPGYRALPSEQAADSTMLMVCSHVDGVACWETVSKRWEVLSGLHVAACEPSFRWLCFAFEQTRAVALCPGQRR